MLNCQTETVMTSQITKIYQKKGRYYRKNYWNLLITLIQKNLPIVFWDSMMHWHNMDFLKIDSLRLRKKLSCHCPYRSSCRYHHICSRTSWIHVMKNISIIKIMKISRLLYYLLSWKTRKMEFWDEEFFGMSSYTFKNFELFILFKLQFDHTR